MEIKITGRNLDLADSVRKYITKKLNKLERVYSRIYSGEVILKEEKSREDVEIILCLKRNKLVAKESSRDMHTSIDNAIDNITKQLRRLNDRVRSNRRRTMLRSIIRPVRRFRQEEETYVPEDVGNQIVKIDMFADKPMLPEEARMELELTGNNFIMFKNADTGESNVVFKRSNGKYGLIEPKF